jgi:acyl dehydratase
MTMSDAMTMINQAAGNEKPVVLDGDEVRGRVETRQYSVDGATLAAYAAATGDTRPERISGEQASPAYAFAPLTKLLFEVVDEVAGDVGPTGVVHTHQDFTFHAPIVAGDELTVVASVADLRPGPFGGVVKVYATTSRADGTVLNSQLVTALVVGSTCVNTVEDAAYNAITPPAVGKPASGSVAIAIDRDHPVRYAAASGDNNPIHLDAAYARTAGFPGPITHGMCTLALASHALEARFPQFATTQRLQVEFTRPVFPGDRLTVRWDEVPADVSSGDGAGVTLFYEVLNRKQRTVMRGGLLQLAP